MNPNPTTLTDLPTGLSNILGAYDEGALADAGLRNQGRNRRAAAWHRSRDWRWWRHRQARQTHRRHRSGPYGMLLDEAIDTGAAYSDGRVTGSIAKAGSFRGAALIVPNGVDAGLIAVALRGRGIFVEGPITVPPAAAVLEGEEQRGREPSRGRTPMSPPQNRWHVAVSKRTKNAGASAEKLEKGSLRPWSGKLRAAGRLETFLTGERYLDTTSREQHHAPARGRSEAREIV